MADSNNSSKTQLLYPKIGILKTTPPNTRATNNDLENKNGPASPKTKDDTYLKGLEMVSDHTRIERCVSTASWVHNVLGVIDNQGKRSCRKILRENRTTPPVLNTYVTKDNSNILNHEPVIISSVEKKSDGPAPETGCNSTIPSLETDKDNRNFVTSIRAAADIIDSIVSTQFKIYNIFSSRNMTPLFLSKHSKSKEYGSRRHRISLLKKCVTDTKKVDGILKELRKLKENSTKNFIKSIENRSAANIALSAWAAGNSVAMERLVERLVIKYGTSGTSSKYTNAGFYRAETSVKSGKVITTKEYMAELTKKIKGNLSFDSATAVFDTSLRRIFKKFKTAALKATEEVDPDNAENLKTENILNSMLRQSRRITDMDCIGMLAPRKDSFGDSIAAANSINGDDATQGEKKTAFRYAKNLQDLASTHHKRGRMGKRKAADDLEITVAQTLIESSKEMDDVGNEINPAKGKEWSMHITQLFAQAFLESISILIQCSFEVNDPFSDKGFEELQKKITIQNGSEMSRKTTTDLSQIADGHLFAIGNFQIPFVIASPDDKIEGRRVSHHTPVLYIVSRKITPATSDGEKAKITSTIALRDRLLVEDDILNKAAESRNNTNEQPENPNTLAASATATANNKLIRMNNDGDDADDKKDNSILLMGGCFPIIRGSKTYDRETKKENEISESLANDWYVSLGVLASIGKTAAAVGAGVARALAPQVSSSDEFSFRTDEKDKRKNLMKNREMFRSNADESYRLLISLGQSLAAWGYSDHNATLESFWSSKTALRSKTVQDSLERTKMLNIRNRIDCYKKMKLIPLPMPKV